GERQHDLPGQAPIRRATIRRKTARKKRTLASIFIGEGMSGAGARAAVGDRRTTFTPGQGCSGPARSCTERRPAVDACRGEPALPQRTSERRLLVEPDEPIRADFVVIS